MDCEVLLPKIAKRGQRMLEAMIQASPVKVTVTEHYKGNAKLLMSYGLGHLERSKFTEAHVRNGGRLVGWDMGYWDRDESMRMTIDQGHPQRHLRDMPGDRWEASGIKLRNDWNQKGPVVVIGMGRKSRRQFGMIDASWEREKLNSVRQLFPTHKILYRPKSPEAFVGFHIADGTIEQVLTGASLVVCRHSNVAVDACIAGVPVVCEDGAAAALYGSDLSKPVHPSEAERLQFLHNLAYFQWTPGEAVQAWRFLLTVLGSTSAAEVGR